MPISNESLLLCKIASGIALDKFSNVKKQSIQFRNNTYDPNKLYELILHCYLFCGFPATIESLKIFKLIYPDFMKNKTKYDVKKYRKSGEQNCKLIYKNNYKKLIDNMNSYSKDMKEWMLIEGYGKIYGRTGLSIKQREMITVSILSARYFENQLHSHIRGCKNVGIIVEDLKEMISKIDVVGKVNLARSQKLIDKVYAKR